MSPPLMIKVEGKEKGKEGQGKQPPPPSSEKGKGRSSRRPFGSLKAALRPKAKEMQVKAEEEEVCTLS